MNDSQNRDQPSGEPPIDIRQFSESYFAAWRDRDPARIAAMHTPDTTFTLHAGSPSVIGRPAVETAFARYFERWPNFAFEVHRVVLGPSHWVLDWTMLSTRTKQVDGRPVAQAIRIDCMDLVVLSPEGLVARKDTFVDASHLRAVLT